MDLLDLLPILAQAATQAPAATVDAAPVGWLAGGGILGAVLAKLVDWMIARTTKQDDRESELVSDLQQRIDKLEADRDKAMQVEVERAARYEKDREECRKENLLLTREVGSLQTTVKSHEARIAELTRAVKP